MRSAILLMTCAINASGASEVSVGADSVATIGGNGDARDVTTDVAAPGTARRESTRMITLPLPLGGRWESVEGRHVLEISVLSSTEASVTFWAWNGGPLLASALPAHWRPREIGAEASPVARKRLDTLVVELEEPGRGPTCNLMVASPAVDAASAGGQQWGPLQMGGPIDEVRLFSEWGASFYEAVLGVYDPFIEEEWERLAWAREPDTFRLVRP